MKSSWVLFVAGLFLTLVGTLVYRETSAGTDFNKESSGIMAPVPDIKKLEGSVAEREKSLEKKEIEVREIRESLEVEKKKLEAQLAELDKLRLEVKKYQELNDKLADDIMLRLVKTYETMDAKKASGVIAVMEDSLAVELLLKMKEKKIAPLLAAMDPSRAMQLSTLVANRRPSGQAVTNRRLNEK